MHDVFVYKTIRTWRKLQGQRHEHLAIYLNVAKNTVINWEQGKTTPDANDLCGLAAFFQVPIEQFFAKRQGDYGSIRPKKKRRARR
jgi:transcriptional regulator with XRE-family HTH domain